MLTAQITNCQNCSNLKELLQSVDCSIKNLLHNKLNNENYNVESYYCGDTVKTLYQYKRIITRKIYNFDYLCGIDLQDIIYQIKKNLFGTCTPCITCEEDTTTTSTSSPNTTSIGSTTSSSSTTNIITPTTTTSTTTNIFSGPFIDTIACGEEVEFGGGEAYPSAYEITLGSGTGTVTLDMDAFNIPDKIVVRFDNVTVIDTGYRGDTSYQGALDTELALLGDPLETIVSPGTDSFTFNKNTSTTSAFVYIFAPLPDTEWTFTLSCPA